MEKFFRSLPNDIGDECPVWKTHGTCPSGLNCRWARSHTSLPSYSLMEKPKEEQIPIELVSENEEEFTNR